MTAEAPVLLDVRDLRVAYGRVEVVQGVNVRVRAGEIVTIVGANGAGKTTTMLAISGLLRGRGSVRFDGRDIAGASPHAIVRAGVVQVPEGRAILAQMSVRENLLLGAWTRRDRDRVGADLAAMFERFPVLRARERLPAGALSGGEQQMLAVGRALMARPRLLLMDEPSLGLAPNLVAQIFEMIASLRSSGVPILLVEQNARQALKLADYAYVFERGRVAYEGPGPEMAAHEGVSAAYLGG